MLYATVFKLVAHNEGSLPANNSYITHAAFLDMVRQVDPGLSGHFHDVNERKPYTVSPLLGHGNPAGDTIRIGAGQEVWMRIALLDAHLFQVVASYLLEKKPLPELRLQGVRFQIVEALTSPESHSRAGYASMDELAQRWQHAETIPDTVTLQFLTPTAMTCGKWWNGQKRFELTPDPVLIWHGVRRQWGLCGGLDPGKAYDTWVEQSVGLIACDIKTRLLHYPDYDQVGFEGWAQFRAVSRDRESLVFWRTLADFAFYAGVGYKTSMGMGQTGVKDG